MSIGISEWNGRVAVVTGGASGIGRGIADALRASGARVVIADRDASALDSAAADGYPVFQTDVTIASDLTALASFVLATEGRIDLLVNNAGVGPKSPLTELTLDDWRWVIEVNLMGVIHGVHAFLPHLIANPDGAWIVNTASMSCFFTPPGYAPYVASKAAVEGLSLTMAKELKNEGHNVGVTVLHPGAVRTNIKESLRNRPNTVGASGLVDFDIAQKIQDDDLWMLPAQVGEIVLRAIKNGDTYAFTHPAMVTDVETSFDTVREAISRYN